MPFWDDDGDARTWHRHLVISGGAAWGFPWTGRGVL
jgi:hypothetical protein